LHVGTLSAALRGADGRSRKMGPPSKSETEENEREASEGPDAFFLTFFWQAEIFRRLQRLESRRVKLRCHAEPSCGSGERGFSRLWQRDFIQIWQRDFKSACFLYHFVPI
jgi:hypothetical protein